MYEKVDTFTFQLITLFNGGRITTKRVKIQLKLVSETRDRTFKQSDRT